MIQIKYLYVEVSLDLVCTSETADGYNWSSSEHVI